MRSLSVRGALGIGLVLPVLVPFSAALAAVSGADLSYVPLGHWSYQAFYRLASLGLIPLHAVASRPIARLEAQRLVREAALRVRDADPVLARLAQRDLQLLDQEFSTALAFEVTLSGLADRGSTDLMPDHSMGASGVAAAYAANSWLLFYGRAAGAGGLGAGPGSELYAAFLLGGVWAQVGRTSAAWGPSLRTGLLLSGNAGAFPLLRLTAELPRARLTKVVASLERSADSSPGDLLFFGTRLDWLPSPRFRIGVSESIITTQRGGMSLYHLVQPLPVFSAGVASYDLHDALGQPRNTAVAIDLDWLPTPGTRLYGELFIDDAPGLSWPAKVGLLVGVFLADPFRTGKTSLRGEYSGVASGTYAYPGPSFNHTYRGLSLGHWLGADGDDLYLELTHQMNWTTTFQLIFAYTRHGQGGVGQIPSGPQDWFLSGVVERRRTLGLSLHQIHSPSLETRYRLEVASVTNRGNVAGAEGLETRVGADLTYRWPAVEKPITFAQPALPPQPVPPLTSLADPGRFSLRAWSPTVTSYGALAGPASSTTLPGIDYRLRLGSAVLALGYDSSVQDGQSFWSADLRYPVGEFTHGAVGVSVGWGGMQFRGELGGSIRTISSSGARVGGNFVYRLALSDRVTPVYLRGEIASGFWHTVEVSGTPPFYLWTYTAGVGWMLPSGPSLEFGYRGAAGVWRVGTPDQTTIRWDGLYFGLSFR